ncbi:efflux RND transporter permease subunit, partial [Sphingomonas koreensis]|uniref:efflux RND transporter permease subunit n=1 Tax=Sphingomonas koreensis TaxID=93064 RepID=UPI0019D2AF91
MLRQFTRLQLRGIVAALLVSLVGAGEVLRRFGYSTNTLYLFGLVLAIAIVADDAIVVDANTQRLMVDKGL